MNFKSKFTQKNYATILNSYNKIIKYMKNIKNSTGTYIIFMVL